MSTPTLGSAHPGASFSNVEPAAVAYDSDVSCSFPCPCCWLWYFVGEAADRCSDPSGGGLKIATEPGTSGAEGWTWAGTGAGGGVTLLPKTLRLRQLVEESAVSPKSVEGEEGSGEAFCDLDVVAEVGGFHSGAAGLG